MNYSVLRHAATSDKGKPYVFDQIVKTDSAGHWQIGARFKAGSNDWIIVYVPSDSDHSYNGFVRLFNDEKGDRIFKSGEIEKAARLLTNFFNPPSRKGNEKRATQPGSGKTLKHSLPAGTRIEDVRRNYVYTKSEMEYNTGRYYNGGTNVVAYFKPTEKPLDKTKTPDPYYAKIPVDGIPLRGNRPAYIKQQLKKWFSDFLIIISDSELNKATYGILETATPAINERLSTVNSKPQHAGYYSPNLKHSVIDQKECARQSYVECDEDEVIDCIEDEVLEHKASVYTNTEYNGKLATDSGRWVSTEDYVGNSAVRTGKFTITYGYANGPKPYPITELHIMPDQGRHDYTMIVNVSGGNSNASAFNNPDVITQFIKSNFKKTCRLSDQECSIIGTRCVNLLRKHYAQHEGYYSPSLSHSTTYIEHHGILGQKWGVRRYQNADGSLTPAGAKRYGVNSASTNDISSKKGIQNRLNDLDSAIMRNKRHSDELYDKAEKYDYKARKWANSNKSNADMKKDEYERKAEEARMKKKEYDDNNKKGVAETNKLIAEAKKLGLKVDESAVKRSVAEMRDMPAVVVKNTLGLALAMLTGFGFMTGGPTLEGTKYKVRTEDEAKKPEKRAHTSKAVLLGTPMSMVNQSVQRQMNQQTQMMNQQTQNDMNTQNMINQQTINNMNTQNMINQQIMQTSISQCNQAASLAMTCGMNPFMFGI